MIPAMAPAAKVNNYSVFRVSSLSPQEDMEDRERRQLVAAATWGRKEPHWQPPASGQNREAGDEELEHCQWHLQGSGEARAIGET